MDEGPGSEVASISRSSECGNGLITLDVDAGVEEAIKSMSVPREEEVASLQHCGYMHCGDIGRSEAIPSEHVLR